MTKEKEKALQKAMRLCSRSEKCAKDIREKLYQWEVPNEFYDEIIETLYDKNFINDKRYAECFANDKIYLSKWGKQKVRFSLKMKGISENLITNAIDTIDTARYNEILRKLLIAKKKTIKASSDYERLAKLIRYGQGRGFTATEINQALNGIV